MAANPGPSDLLKQARTALRHAAHLYVKTKDPSKRLVNIENLENAAITLAMVSATCALAADRAKRAAEGDKEDG